MNLFDQEPDALQKARAMVLASREDGVTCPCCGLFVKVYRRKLNSTMARSLIWLVKQFEKTGEWVDVGHEAPAWLLSTSQLQTVAHWGLIERAPNDNPAKKTSGLWMPTHKGNEFVYGRASVPSHVYLFNAEAMGFDDTTVTIQEALGKHFNYSEMMRGDG